MILGRRVVVGACGVDGEGVAEMEVETPREEMAESELNPGAMDSSAWASGERELRVVLLGSSSLGRERGGEGGGMAEAVVFAEEVPRELG